MTLQVRPYRHCVIAKREGDWEFYSLDLVRMDMAVAIKYGSVCRNGNTFDESDLTEIRARLREIARQRAGIK